MLRVLQSRDAGVAAPREPRHACALRGIGTKPPRAPGGSRARRREAAGLLRARRARAGLVPDSCRFPQHPERC
ncbi:hypothetical protein AQ808_01180 [Burkholderia pseudomallei]|nr:hypothetical protein AQ808_01180 [Burkholderia pseudomallei]